MARHSCPMVRAKSAISAMSRVAARPASFGHSDIDPASVLMPNRALRS